MDRRNRKRWSGVVRGGAAVLAVFGMTLGGCGEQKVEEKPVVRPVKQLTLSGSGKTEILEFPGKISPAQNAELAFEVSGKITELPVEEGQVVQKGAILARLDPRDYKANLDAAVAREKAAAADLERARALLEKEVISQQQFDVAHRNFEVSKADADKARKAVEDAVLRAPFAGKVAKKLVQDFANVQAKEPVVVLQDTSHLEMIVAAPEADYTRMKPGVSKEARSARGKPVVIVSSLPGREFPARLKEMATTADPITRTYAVTLAFDNPPDLNILPGMTAKVRIAVPEDIALEGTWIPARAAVTDGSGEAFVWVVDPTSMTVERRAVVLGELSGELVLVREGLEGGETLATSGVHQLREGMQVRRFEQ